MNKVMALIYQPFESQPPRYYTNSRCIMMHDKSESNLFFETSRPEMTCLYYNSEYKLLKRRE